MPEFFQFLHLTFDVDLAKKLAKKYDAVLRHPEADWILPLVWVEPSYVAVADLLKPVIFAVLPAGEEVATYLIDGNHAVRRALNEKVSLIPTVVLTVEDSLKTLVSDRQTRDAIQANAIKQGLI